MSDEQKKLIVAARKLSGNEDFKIFLDAIADFCRVDEECFVADNERVNAYWQGRRSVALHFRKLMKEL